MKKAKKPTFSPDISPINGNLQETLRDSRLENEHHWMDKPYPDGMLSTTEKGESQSKLDKVQHREERNLYDESGVQNSRQSQLTYQMPLQMQQSSHVVYQSYPQPLAARGTDVHQSVAVARYLPVQQQSVAYHPISTVNYQTNGG